MFASDTPSFDIKKDLTILVLPILFLFFLAIFVPTNGLGSNGLIFVLICVLWKERELRNHWWQQVWPLLLIVVVYFIAMSAYAFSRVTALRDGLEVLKGISLSMVALYLIRLSEPSLRRTLEYVVIVLSITTLALIIFNLHQHNVMSFIDNQEFAWYVNRNRLAVGFSITSIFITALMVEERSLLKSGFLSMLWVMLALAGFLNGSRGALMGMLVATLLIILVAIPRIGWKRVFRSELWLFPVFVICAAVSWLFLKHISLNKYMFHDGKGIDTGRYDIWQTVSERVVQAPWFGFGPHVMKFDPMLAAIRNKYDVTHPHSIYIGLVYASGIVGILFWLCWLTSFSYKIRQNFMTNNNVSYYVGVGLLVNIVVHGFVDFDFYMYAVFAYIIIGLVMVLPKRN